MLSFLRNFHSVLHSECINLHSQWYKNSTITNSTKGFPFLHILSSNAKHVKVKYLILSHFKLPDDEQLDSCF